MLAHDRQQRHAAVEAEVALALRTADERFAADREAIDRELAETCAGIEARHQKDARGGGQRHRVARKELRDGYRSEKAAALVGYKEARWTLGALLEGKKEEAEKLLREQQAELADYAERFAGLRSKSSTSWRPGSSRSLTSNPPAPGKPRRLASYQTAGEERLRRLRALRVPRYAQPGRLLALRCPCGWC